MNKREDMPGNTIALAPPPPSYSFPPLKVTTLITESAELKTPEYLNCLRAKSSMLVEAGTEAHLSSAIKLCTSLLHKG